MIKYLIIVLFSSCAYFKQVSHPEKKVVRSKSKAIHEYTLKDKAGTFSLKREVGISKNDKDFVVKKIILSQEDKTLPLEKTITISKPGSLKGKINILRPQVSQYSVWFEKKKYFSEMKIMPKEKKLLIKLKSPFKKWNGNKEVLFPKGSGLYCFFSQVVECAKFNNFISESTKRGLGEMNFHIIWEGYPYFHAQYDNLPSKVFSDARMSYEGKNAQGYRKYSLSFDNQTLFYLLDKQSNIIGQYWVSQGYSLEKKL
ncbi:MAG: hypothetical protein ACO20H_02965 [Bacteriovoracaceae bacterium]